jgi:pyruvate formate lyase activating enzyme
MEGVIFDIKRFAIHDGPGIRTTVFLKGCPLNCSWCHNPESRKKGVEKIWSAKEDKYLALGRKVGVEDVMNEILADKIFYSSSNGGVTFSGGEPTLQLDFLESLLKQCKNEGLHTAVDTSGYVNANGLKRILAYTDLFLYDLKMMDAEKHRKYTGVSNQLILENLQLLLSEGALVDLRIPLIPQINDSKTDMEALVAFIRAKHQIRNIHLLPYHRTGQHKYEKFHLKPADYLPETPDDHYLQRQRDFFNAHGLKVIHGG